MDAGERARLRELAHGNDDMPPWSYVTELLADLERVERERDSLRAVASECIHCATLADVPERVLELSDAEADRDRLAARVAELEAAARFVLAEISAALPEGHYAREIVHAALDTKRDAGGEWR